MCIMRIGFIVKRNAVFFPIFFYLLFVACCSALHVSFPSILPVNLWLAFFFYCSTQKHQQKSTTSPYYIPRSVVNLLAMVRVVMRFKCILFCLNMDYGLWMCRGFILFFLLFSWNFPICLPALFVVDVQSHWHLWLWFAIFFFIFSFFSLFLLWIMVMMSAQCSHNVCGLCSCFCFISEIKMIFMHFFLHA